MPHQFDDEIQRLAQRLVEPLAPLLMQRMAGVGARAHSTAPISVPNTTATLLTFTGTRFDVGGFYASGTPNQLVAPVAGTYLVGVNIYWVAASGGRRLVEILQAGTPIALSEIGSPAVNTSAPQQIATTIWPLTAGQSVQFRVFQDSGATQTIGVAANYSPEAWIWRLGA